jgi:hypothetical protein
MFMVLLSIFYSTLHHLSTNITPRMDGIKMACVLDFRSTSLFDDGRCIMKCARLAALLFCLIFVCRAAADADGAGKQVEGAASSTSGSGQVHCCGPQDADEGAQSPSSKQPAQKKAKKKKEDEDKVIGPVLCPLYKVMDYGTYATYYAGHQSSNCTTYAMLSAASNLTNLACHNNCI